MIKKTNGKVSLKSNSLFDKKKLVSKKNVKGKVSKLLVEKNKSLKKENQTLLDELLSESEDLQKFDVEKIYANDVFNSRKNYDNLEELAESIKKYGQLQAVGITRKNKLIYGFRRFKAITEILKLKTIHVQYVEDVETSIKNVIENIQREDLNDQELCEAVNELKLEGKTLSEIATIFCKTLDWVKKKSQRFNVTKDLDKTEFENLDKISDSHINTLSTLECETKKEIVKKLNDEVKENGIVKTTIKELKNEIDFAKKNQKVKVEVSERELFEIPFSETYKTYMNNEENKNNYISFRDEHEKEIAIRKVLLEESERLVNYFQNLNIEFKHYKAYDCYLDKEVSIMQDCLCVKLQQDLVYEMVKDLYHFNVYDFINFEFVVKRIKKGHLFFYHNIQTNKMHLAEYKGETNE